MDPLAPPLQGLRQAGVLDLTAHLSQLEMPKSWAPCLERSVLPFTHLPWMTGCCCRSAVSTVDGPLAGRWICVMGILFGQKCTFLGARNGIQCTAVSRDRGDTAALPLVTPNSKQPE